MTGRAVCSRAKNHLNDCCLLTSSHSCCEMDRQQSLHSRHLLENHERQQWVDSTTTYTVIAALQSQLNWRLAHCPLFTRNQPLRVGSNGTRNDCYLSAGAGISTCWHGWVQSLRSSQRSVKSQRLQGGDRRLPQSGHKQSCRG